MMPDEDVNEYGPALSPSKTAAVYSRKLRRDDKHYREYHKA